MLRIDSRKTSICLAFRRSFMKLALKVLLAWLVAAPCMGAQTIETTTNNNHNSAGLDARMMRFPDISRSQICFVYAGDIWVAPKTGGAAYRLSSPRGEETFPRFSPDGTEIAFTGNYDGNNDIYVVPTAGGMPRRVTFHGAPDRMLDWHPDGKSILFASTRTSEKDRFNHLYTIPAEGGLPTRIPVPYGEFGMLNGDGNALAYVPVAIDFRTWKRYRGGMNPAIWLFDMKTQEARDLTGNAAANTQPMWHGSTLYFLSDRDKNKRSNIWAYDTQKNQMRQVTHFEELDVHFPSIGPEELIFECGGRLYVLDLANEKQTEVKITVATDRATLKPRLADVSKMAREPDISPAGKRVVFEARGEIFTVPAENGVVRNLTRSSGVAERFPAWSPDGKSIAYFSDRSGEYELTIRPADGSGTEEVLTKLGPGYRYRPMWSPDSKKIVFIDQAMRVHLHNLDTKKTSEIAKQLWMYHGGLNSFRVSWSKDSRWIAFGQELENLHTAICLYDVQEEKKYQVTSGYYDDDLPVFDPDGKYLFYRTGRAFNPVYSDLDNTWIYPNSFQLAAVSLRKDVPSPLAPRNDDEGEKKDKKDEAADKKEDKKEEKDSKPKEPEVAVVKKGEHKHGSAKPAEKSEDKKADEKKPEDKKDKPAKTLEIDIAGFEGRAVVLPMRAGRYGDLYAVSGKLIFRRLPFAADIDDRSALMVYELEKREEKVVLDDVDGASIAAKGDKLLVRRKGDYAIIDAKDGQRFDKRVPVSGMETMIDPAAEWRQIFTETWRLERDYFYDPAMHGVNWPEMRERYGALLKEAVTRWDVNYIIGELISELSASHTYRSGGDLESEPQRGVGYLGVDFELTNRAYRIKTIIQTAEWDATTRSPLKEPGVDVKEGDYLLAVNGLAVDTEQEPAAAFQGLAGEPVFLTVNSEPKMEGAREVLVKTLSSEANLRHLAWIEANRKRVETASKGQIGYVYVPDTSRSGQSELVRQFRAQFTKPGLIIDERFNSGGQIPDRFVELLSRKTLNYWGVRDGKDWSWPQVAHSGPKAMLINGWSGSGGDGFPYYFKKAGLGPLIGARTWGGLIGITGTPPLVDDGSVTVPTFGIYSTKGEWIIESVGVDPDIAVVDDPGLMAKGRDPQLERAVQEVLKELEKNPPTPPQKPKYPVRSGK